jgi:hypothetical protein
MSIAAAPSFEGFFSFSIRAQRELRIVSDRLTIVRTWQGGSLELPADGSTHFLYAFSGASELRVRVGAFPFSEGMYCCLTEGRVQGGGCGIGISHGDFSGVFQIGGPLEARGRLRYIDGCTDSLLIPPALRGDPCLNHLHIPPRTRQTLHTHPSVRIGVIASGEGRCLLPDCEEQLHPGLGFVIAKDTRHAFVTDESSLAVVVYHPETDTGPTHEDHPMINRTIL